MKTKILAAAVAATSLTSVAHAQSSVTMYGFISDGVRYVNNTAGGSTFQMSNAISPERWGLFGSEDLGGGNKAVFQLENYFNINTGAMTSANTLWYGKAYMGIDSQQFGRLTFGRQYATTALRAIMMDPIYIGGGIAAICPLGQILTDVWTRDSRTNNNIVYTKHIGDFALSASYNPSGVAGASRAGVNYSGDIYYAAHGLEAAVSFQRQYSPDETGTQDNWWVGATYTYGSLKGYLNLVTLRLTTIDGAAGSTRRDYVTTIGARYQPTPYLTLIGAYYIDVARNLSNVDGANGNKNTAYIEALYSLSKSTSLYLEADRNWFTGAYKYDKYSTQTLLNMSPGSSAQLGVSVGLVHNF